MEGVSTVGCLGSSLGLFVFHLLVGDVLTHANATVDAEASELASLGNLSADGLTALGHVLGSNLSLDCLWSMNGNVVGVTS